MNKRVLQAVIALLWVFLAGFTVLKLFFGEWFVATAQTEKIIEIGDFIDTHTWAKIIADLIISMISAHFYFCACKQVWRLSTFREYLVFLYVIGSYILSMQNTVLYTVVDVALMLLLPLVIGSKLKQVLCVFLLNYAGQFALLFIRSEPIYLASTNYAVRFILFFDAELWFILYYLYSNLYKEGTLWEFLFSHFSVIKRKKSLKKNLPK